MFKKFRSTIYRQLHAVYSPCCGNSFSQTSFLLLYFHDITLPYLYNLLVNVVSIFQNLIDNCTFTLFWHSYIQHMSQSWSHICLTDDTLRVVAFLQAFTGCNKDWCYRCFFIPFYHWQGIAMQTVYPFF